MGAIQVFEKRFNPCTMTYFLTPGSFTPEEERNRGSHIRTVPPGLSSFDNATLF